MLATNQWVNRVTQLQKVLQQTVFSSLDNDFTVANSWYLLFLKAPTSNHAYDRMSFTKKIKMLVPVQKKFKNMTQLHLRK